MQRATALAKEASSKATVPVRSPRLQSRLLQRKCACGGTAGPSGECAECKRKRLALQPKLAINQPGDRYEQEADRVAEAIVSGATSNRPLISSLGSGAVQREEPGKPKSEEEKYKEAAKKVGEAFLETPPGKEIRKKAEDLGDAFISTLPGKIIAGSAVAGAVATLAATHKELPIGIPEIPLDKIKPGLKMKLTYKGPVDKPSKVAVGFSIPLGGKSGGKKGGPSESERRQAETARLVAEQRKIREGLKTDEEKAADQKRIYDYVASRMLRADQLTPRRSPLSFGIAGDELGFKPGVPQAEHSPLGPLVPNFKLSGEVPADAAPLKEEKKEETVQRKASDDHEVAGAPPIIEDVLQSTGEPLDPATRRFMEKRFGHDFGRVRVHRGARAAESARVVHAQAYTVGTQIAFDTARYQPSTPEGRLLLAHELTHVVQQGGTRSGGGSALPIGQTTERETDSDVSGKVEHSPLPARRGFAVSALLQRAPPPPHSPASQPFYQEALDSLAEERKQIITIVRSQIIPDSVPLLEKLVALCEAIDRGATADISKALTDFLASNTEHLPLTTPSNGLVAEMIARMLALGLDAETRKLRRWSIARDKEISPGFHQGFSHEIFMWERIEERLLEQIPETGGAAALKSIDTLLLFFKQLHRERVSLSAEEIAKDQKKRAELFDNYFVQRDRTISVYAAELVRLMRETFIGIQAAFQVVLDQAAEDLAQGRGGAMLQDAKDRLENKLLGLIEPKDKEQHVTSVPVETTRSEFKEGGGVHFDYFAKTEAAKKKRSVKIEFYDREQLPSLASEMQSDFGGVFLARRRQIELLEEIYGLQKDDKGSLTSETKENAAAISKMGAGGMHLHSDDDWRKFVVEKFELREATDGPEKALSAVIVLLEKYLKVFTTHTPYNIEDFGDNLLTKTFPRDLAGRLIHDCGVYALRVAYILSLLRDNPKLKLRFRYAVMPLHVGLIITGENLPLFLVNNDTITRYTAADIAALRAEWNQLDEQGEIGTPAKPGTEARFAGEVMADAFISGVDLPYKEIEVAKPGGSPAAMKAQLWQQYTSAVAPSADKLFGPSVKDPESPNYQFYLRYLKLLGLGRDFHNNFLVPFWNVTANALWDQHKNEIAQAGTALRQAKAKQKAAAQKTYDAAVQKYTDEFDPAFALLQDKYQPIILEQLAVQEHIRAHPEVFTKGAEVESSNRVRAMFEALGVGGTWWENAIYDHLRDLRSNKVQKAPFAGPDKKLLPVN
ncbi:MAG: DUF4157 domain-containing protein [Chthoniobacterales bacterium]